MKQFSKLFALVALCSSILSFCALESKSAIFNQSASQSIAQAESINIASVNIASSRTGITILGNSYRPPVYRPPVYHPTPVVTPIVHRPAPVVHRPVYNNCYTYAGSCHNYGFNNFTFPTYRRIALHRPVINHNTCICPLTGRQLCSNATHTGRTYGTSYSVNFVAAAAAVSSFSYAFAASSASYTSCGNLWGHNYNSFCLRTV